MVAYYNSVTPLESLRCIKLFPFIKQLKIIVVLFVLKFHFYHFCDFSFAVSCHFLQLSMCHHKLIYCILSITSSRLTLVGEPDNHACGSHVQSRCKQLQKEGQIVSPGGDYRSSNGTHFVTSFDPSEDFWVYYFVPHCVSQRWHGQNLPSGLLKCYCLHIKKGQHIPMAQDTRA